jgi:protein-disulfide isomerase
MRRVGFLLGTLILVALASIYAALRLIPAPNALPPSAFDAAMRDYILRHPEVVLESVGRMQAQQRAQASAEGAQQAAVIANRAQLLGDPTSQVAGNPNGDVALVLFFDYRCPYCKQGVGEEKALLMMDPGVRVIYKEFPILGPPSVTASRAALASVKQGKYLPFHDAMMAFHGDFTDAEIFAMAQGVGIEVERLKSDMGSDDITAVLRTNFVLAQTLGINGTPAYVIGDRLLGGVTSAAEFEQFAKDARAAQAAMARP